MRKINFTQDYGKDPDHIRAATAWRLLCDPQLGVLLTTTVISKEFENNAGKYLRDCWTGNYLQRGTPLFWHPLLDGYQNKIVDELGRWSKTFMGKENKACFDNLPDAFTIYRGGSSEGPSWTLSETTAKKFGKVHKSTIYKHEVFAYVNDREEEEVIVLDHPWNWEEWPF